MIIVAGGGGSGGGATLEAQAADALLAGNVVYADITGQWKLALAATATATRAYGFISTSVSIGFAGVALNAGQLELTTAAWDSVIEGAGTGGLSPGTRYFLSRTAVGEITTTPVSSGYRVPVGRAITTTRMAVHLDEFIKLAS